MITRKTIARFGGLGVLKALLPMGSGGACYSSLLLVAFILSSSAFAQIKIGGNVYGGGNMGKVSGNTTVTVRAGDIGTRPSGTEGLENPRGKVFGGARMADVGGSSLVHIDGANASGDMVINQVYGGNDIAGVVGSNPEAIKRTSDELAEQMPLAAADGVDNTWNSYVRVSSKMSTPDVYYTQSEIDAASESDPAYGKTTSDKKTQGTRALDNKGIYIGQLFGGGNGDYRYDVDTNGETGKTTYSIYPQGGITSIATKVVQPGITSFTYPPDVAKSYLDVHGGSIVYAYGGGNNATVSKQVVIRVDNPAQVTNSVEVDDEEILTLGRFKDMGINMGFSHPSSGEYQIGCFFGGNNQAEMRIRPSWHLQHGLIRSLYSGGNRGSMTYENGLFMEIPEGSTLVANDVYGGCRMADVRPKKWYADREDPQTLELGYYDDVEHVNNDIPSYNFPRDMAARVIVAGGDVNNVYGGNDVTGRVYFGNAVGIMTSVRGNVYGGGNGSYPYTDNESLKDDGTYGDLYYEHSGNAAQGLLNFRPNAEQVSIILRGTEDKKTIIGGSVYLGGNCATLISDNNHAGLANYPVRELKLGSYVIADKVYLGNNGEGMLTTNKQEGPAGNPTKMEGVLRTFQRTDIAPNGEKFNSMELTDPADMKIYMEGVAMADVPSLIVESEDNGSYDYISYTSYIGSLYYGGNRGSMTYSGPININLNEDQEIYIYDKLVGGCNNAYVPEQIDEDDPSHKFNAVYDGGILGDADEQLSYTDDGGNIKDRVIMNLSKIRIKPMRLNSTGTDLEWNTVESDGTPTNTATMNYSYTGAASAADKGRRFVGGNVYGGCSESGHVNGNVVINLLGSMHNRNDLFDTFSELAADELTDNILYDRENYTISNRKSGVILNEQGMDVEADALSVHGGGRGLLTEIWGSATVNVNKGYTFQIFGGSERGVIGKQNDGEGESYTFNGKTFKYNSKYSTTVNLNGDRPGASRTADGSAEMADVEFIYGGGNEGLIVGNTNVNLDNGRLFNCFTGSANADILGHTETKVGFSGFPYLRDHIYGGNDLGGEIKGVADFTDRVSAEAISMVHNTDLDDGTGAGASDGIPDVLQANSYVEYRQGRMKYIFGGCYGDYDYEGEFSAVSYPKINNAFINFTPNNHLQNEVEKVFGAGQGSKGIRLSDKMQKRSYVLVDIPGETSKKVADTEVFGGGDNSGLGMSYTPAQTFEPGFNLDKASAIIDLVRGQIGSTYGGSYQEGVTRRTVVNVPENSTISLTNIFGGAYGTRVLPPCDVYESNVNYRNTSETAFVTGAIYGGNNNERRTLFTNVNISSPVWAVKNDPKKPDRLTTVYGAGKGIDTWAEHTQVNLLNGAQVYEVYGGGEMGHVLNAESVQKYMQLYSNKPSHQISGQDEEWRDPAKWVGGEVGGTLIDDEEVENEWKADWKDAWEMGDYFTPNADYTNYIDNAYTNLSRISNRAELDDETASMLAGKKFNTNVIINEGATVDRYAYGGGLGDQSVHLSGDIYGTTYIALLGGEVKRDIYASCTAGSVNDIFGAKNFTASTNAYIQGGTVRNVYGGGWRGSVGHHNGALSNVAENVNDIPGVSNVVIGKQDGTSYINGIPSITRSVFGGGEGGNVYGTANIYVNNGYIGYRYKNTAADDEPAHYEYVPELDDKATGDNLLDESGNVFGGGYICNSYVDNTDVRMYGGVVRGSLFGGGEKGPIGRGTVKTGAPSTGITHHGARIYKAGKTKVRLYDGWVKRNVYGGGRGYNTWHTEDYVTPAEMANLDDSSKGYVFGQTEVCIYGGEVGTDEEMKDKSTPLEQKNGNVFGGGDVGKVYSGYQDGSGVLAMGNQVTGGERFDGGEECYYYKYEKQDGEYDFVTVGGEKVLTEDCKVLIEPWCKVGSGTVSYAKDKVVSANDMAYLSKYSDRFADVLSAIDGTNTVSAEGGISFEKNELTIEGHVYESGDYVPTSALNYLGNKNDTEWVPLASDDVNKDGIIIHNAVFAGGNTSESNSGGTFVNTTTVFGNATASIHDVYNRDLITVGTGHTGGLYGDGNLTLVDGYRELNITNYGTDYYSILKEITYAQYLELPVREAAYYEIRYKCLQQCQDKNHKTYMAGSTITADEFLTVFDGVTVSVDDEDVSMIKPDGKPLEAYWTENGVCSRYAGRIMNTIQRADFCGVFGSRMVMQGARDRVPETVDYTNYTINRVHEVSLNKKMSKNPGDAEHGNYFGIYNVVNYLGALTSDVDFETATRFTDNTDALTYKCDADDIPYETATFAQWKKAFKDDRRRNNGNSHNKVALASGVYLELTTEKSTGVNFEDKDWGIITGVVELDLINVQQGMGGGFVYAKNLHGKRNPTGKSQTLLSNLNKEDGSVGSYDAVTNKQWQYVEVDGSVELKGQEEWQTSGNFVHSTQTIVDDCYNIGGRYELGKNPVPAHYWFIKGSVYIYDQYVSAYTGSPNAYSEIVNIPLTITSASFGRMTLLNVKPNRYAYYSVYTNDVQTPLTANDEIVLRDVSYKLNDPINYWEWERLTPAEQNLFVEKTYVATANCTIGEGDDAVDFAEGTVLLPSQYAALKATAIPKKLDEDDPYYEPTEPHLTPSVHHTEKNKDVAFDYVFRESNNLGNETGYILTYRVNNPEVWNTWYTLKEGSAADKIMSKDYAELSDVTSVEPTVYGKDAYEDGPTYHLKTGDPGGLLGQREYAVGNIISENTKHTYDEAYLKLSTDQKAALGTTQATFGRAWIVTADLLEITNKNETEQRLHKGATLAEEDYSTAVWNSMYDSDHPDATTNKVAEAYVVTSTVQLTKTDYIYRDTYMTLAEKNKFKTDYPSLAEEIEASVVPAYYCISEGLYGGDYYQPGHNYRAMAAFTSMSEDDRDRFDFNYDALDLLIDPAYSGNEGVKYQYDGKGYTTSEQAKQNDATYSLETPIDYTATYMGDDPLTYKLDAGGTGTANKYTELSRTEYEGLPNERNKYAPITVTDIDKTYYVVNVNDVSETMVLGDTPYATGQLMDETTYATLSDGEKDNVDKIVFTDPSAAGKTYYYCRKSYEIDADLYPAIHPTHGTVTTATSVKKNGVAVVSGSWSDGNTVPKGTIISEDVYTNLINSQANFAIHGTAPTETSTLYVPRNSDINDLSTEKIITVIYKYDYIESDMAGLHITPYSEYHVLNIHIDFKSGVPTVEDIQAPEIVLPGTSVSIKEPHVTPGAYEVTGGGWELFDSESDAESHINGVAYTPLSDPLYLYQNKNYMAYYAKTYLGKTYSNAVQVSVANYHDLKKVMEATEHHYYIDHKEVIGKDIEPKIYINDYSKDATGSKNGLDLFKNLYDLSILVDPDVDDDTGLIEEGEPFEGHKPLNSRVAAGEHLEFFLRSDIDHSDTPWAPVGESICFAGTFHGDGHAITGLSNSLFGKLCGQVYNLGVEGSFTSAGIAETGSGYVENCWVKTSSTAAKTSKPVFGTPTIEPGTTRPYRIVNCYYAEEDDAANKYTNHSGDYGIPTRKPAQSFYNGEVAYNLNGFYLYKRYNDNANPGGTTAYKYYLTGVTDPETGSLIPQDGTYASNAQWCSSGDDRGDKYVEERYADGDFRYAAGSIPGSEDVRTYTDPADDSGSKMWYPIWPDDYIFFGQALNYGHVDGLTHQDVPTAYDGDNRVYRAPAYFQNSVMSVAHYNPNAVFAQSKKNDPTTLAYKNMTAIDFTGSNGDVAGGYKLGLQGGRFYTPLLDDVGLTGFLNADLTKNLLVYTPAAGQTAEVVDAYLPDAAYSESTTDPAGYRCVAYQSPTGIFGHRVVAQAADNFVSAKDHFLVDKQDFNAPMRYTFTGGKRMWYQRDPELFAGQKAREDGLGGIVTDGEGNPIYDYDSNAGWEGISLPFTAELVTTDKKGELTHFYNGSTLGHEYWLREFAEGGTVDPDNADVFIANFNPVSAATEGAESTDKTVMNTFLWDYYYQGLSHGHQDKNLDEYQTYYTMKDLDDDGDEDCVNQFNGYPLLSRGIPYLIGFPGEFYYEFDLSGKFKANTTASDRPVPISKQLVTFASKANETIEVSDTEMREVTNDGYTFRPNYLNRAFEAGTGRFTLSAVGDCYHQVPAESTPPAEPVADTPQTAFRPYFTFAGVGGVKGHRAEARTITFSRNTSEIYGQEDEDDDISKTGRLIIRAEKGKIVVSSTLQAPKLVSIVSVGGATIDRYTIQPGETIETTIRNQGVYIVNRKKLSVR